MFNGGQNNEYRYLYCLRYLGSVNRWQLAYRESHPLHDRQTLLTKGENMDINHNYGSLEKYTHRLNVWDTYNKLLPNRDRAKDHCTTLTATDGHDVAQFKPHFGTNIRIVNNDGGVIDNVWDKYGFLNCYIGDAYKAFSSICRNQNGLFYLDTVQLMATIGADFIDNNGNWRAICVHLQRFFDNAQSGTVLALNACYNFARKHESPDATKRQIVQKIRDTYKTYNLKGWHFDPRTFDTYQSTARTRMVTAFFTKP
jgi:hypothetical protein